MLPGQNFRVAQSVAQDFYLNQIPSHAVSQILMHQNRPDQSCIWINFDFVDNYSWFIAKIILIES